MPMLEKKYVKKRFGSLETLEFQQTYATKISTRIQPQALIKLSKFILKVLCYAHKREKFGMRNKLALAGSFKKNFPPVLSFLFNHTKTAHKHAYQSMKK